VAFHFHPLVYYRSWEEDYRRLAARLQQSFLDSQVAYISFGTVTLIKPAVRAIRRRGGCSRILQMEFSSDPHGKLTYPEHIKLRLFSELYRAFSLWHERVFFYLCMEPAHIWDRVFGRHYPSRRDFLEDFGLRIGAKPRWR
jgi:spore photoproduct lyase